MLFNCNLAPTFYSDTNLKYTVSNYFETFLFSYIPWNVHEPSEGIYSFDGQQDLGAFLELANEIGLLVIARAGPYSCGEWEFVSA